MDFSIIIIQWRVCCYLLLAHTYFHLLDLTFVLKLIKHVPMPRAIHVPARTRERCGRCVHITSLLNYMKLCAVFSLILFPLTRERAAVWAVRSIECFIIGHNYYRWGKKQPKICRCPFHEFQQVFSIQHSN